MQNNFQEEPITKQIKDDYKRDRVAVVDHANTIKGCAALVEAYVVILCLSGKVSLVIDGKHYLVKTNDLIVCTPNTYIEEQKEQNSYECIGLVVAPEYFQKAIVLSSNVWNIKQELVNNPVICLSDAEAKMFTQYCNVIRVKLSREHRQHYKEGLSFLISAFICDFYDAMETRFSQNTPLEFSSAETIFGKFVQLINDTHPKRREVKFYAQQLCISPKYLSVICKRLTGNTASDLISEMVVKDIQNMLYLSDKSIKEIAVELGFDNLSFFGKFVKRELGMSPKALRHKKNEQ